MDMDSGATVPALGSAGRPEAGPWATSRRVSLIPGIDVSLSKIEPLEFWGCLRTEPEFFDMAGFERF